MPVSTIVGKNLQYTYSNGWKYEFWLKSETRIVYEIHGGPMNGRYNYQTCWTQEVREDEIFQIGWVEETGTIVNINVDLARNKLFTFMTFSKGHWENAEAAHGDKRNQSDFDRWRGLAKIGSCTTDRHTVMEHANIDSVTEGRGHIRDIDPTAPTL